MVHPHAGVKGQVEAACLAGPTAASAAAAASGRARGQQRQRGAGCGMQGVAAPAARSPTHCPAGVHLNTLSAPASVPASGCTDRRHSVSLPRLDDSAARRRSTSAGAVPLVAAGAAAAVPTPWLLLLSLTTKPLSWRCRLAASAVMLSKRDASASCASRESAGAPSAAAGARRLPTAPASAPRCRFKSLRFRRAVTVVHCPAAAWAAGLAAALRCARSGWRGRRRRGRRGLRRRAAGPVLPVAPVLPFTTKEVWHGRVIRGLLLPHAAAAGATQKVGGQRLGICCLRAAAASRSRCCRCCICPARLLRPGGGRWERR